MKKETFWKTELETYSQWRKLKKPSFGGFDFFTFGLFIYSEHDGLRSIRVGVTILGVGVAIRFYVDNDELEDAHA